MKSIIVSKIKIFLFLNLTLWCNFPSLRASHMMGADMSYVHLGNSKYKITFKIYRDCRDIAFNNPTFGAYAGLNGANGCGSVTLANATRISIRDITQRCSTDKSPCNPANNFGTGKGVEEHTFEAIVDFEKPPLNQFINNSTCCEVTFFTGQCCRNGSITTGSATQDFFTTCMINICSIKKTLNNYNSSPQLSNMPIGFLCCNTPWYYNISAIDTIDNDSISYKLVNGLRGIPSLSVSYNSPFTNTYPMTPYCTPSTTISCIPNPKNNPPVGFYFDTTNGDMVVTPTKCDEVPIVVVELTEWRKDEKTGIWLIVGKTRRDMQMWILDDCGSNNPPKINGIQYIIAIEGDKICQKITVTDKINSPNQSIPDTVFAQWNQGIIGATFKVIDSLKREKEYEFCWQTKDGDAREVPYTFAVQASDQHCSPPLISVKSFKVKVLPRNSGTLTAKQNVKLLPEVLIYPNPAVDEITLKILNSNIEEPFSIYSITGIKLMEGTIKSEVNLNINDLSEGVYFLKTKNQNIKLLKH